MKTALLAAMLMATTAAQAVTWTATPGAPDPGPNALLSETVLVDFDSAIPAGITLSGSYTIASGSSAGRAPPAGDSTKYFAVPDAGREASSGTARINFTSYIASTNPLRSLSFYWGSVDSYNTLEVLNTSGQIISTIFGNDINNPANGDQSNAASNRRLFLNFAPGDNFGSLRFISTSRAFEIDDIATSAVPEPQTWALLLAGFGMVGHAVRRRRQMASVAA